MVLLVVMIKSDVSFFYNMDDNSKTDYDCFYAYIIEDSFVEKDGTVLRTDYLTPYCLRPSSNHSSILIEGNFSNTTTFKSLRSQQISSKQLYEWSISIDIIEQYTMYLSTNDTKFDEIIFYNCSSSWFGSHCQYTFGSNTLIKSFGDFLVSSFKNRKEYSGKIIINTCYPHLSECYRGPEPMCLDWREICDGKIDCIGNNYGLDEQYCEELEINECTKGEYRCHNGAQCIPLDFYEDGVMSKDCLDGTDENTRSLFPIELNCIDIVTFACEEKTCTRQISFVCGDGQCLQRPLISVPMFPMKSNCQGTGRDLYHHQAVYSSAKYLSTDCYKFLFCTLNFYYILPNDIYDEKMCLFNNWLLSNNCSIELLSFPPKTFLFNYFQLIYSSEKLVHNSTGIILPNYICNDPRSCLHLPNTTFQIGDLVCHPTEQFIEPNDYIKDMGFINTLLNRLFEFCSLTGNTNENYRSKSSLFYCQLSDKYISKHRLIDRIVDCHYEEDESAFDNCLLNHPQLTSCEAKKKCLSALRIIDPDFPNCVDTEDNLIGNSQESVFRRLCNVINNYLTSSDSNETDESNCEWWPCNNPYTRCDNIYQCGNGIDEIGCPNYNCSVNELKCYMNDSVTYRCIPHAYIYEKPANCPPSHGFELICRRILYSSNFTNNKNEYLSWKENGCIKEHNITGCKSNNDQHLICAGIRNIRFHSCPARVFDMDNNGHLCTLTSPNQYLNLNSDRVFSTLNLGYLPSIINTASLSSHEHINEKIMKIEDMNNSIELIEYCNRGIVIFEGKSYKKKCLCSPSYFGNQCQWQNQRISLTLRIRKLSSFANKIFIYEIFIYLIDNKYQRIDYYEKIQYIPSIDCEKKFNRYLIYSIRPKHLNSNYSIHIDIYDKMTLNYYGSWYLFLPFQFLPVNRLSTQLLIPVEKSESFQNCSLECGNHGKCFFYINSVKPFCKCDQNYSGQFCNLTYQCLCSPDSICLNSSICLCPLNKFGSKCYIQSESCQPNNPCKNNGRCIPMDDRIKKNGFICFCTEDYMGSTCEYKSNRIDLTFKTDIIPSIIYAHFITGFQNKKHERTTKFKKVPFDQNSISLFSSQPFHILFIEFFNNYYLSVLRETLIPSEYISTDIKSDNICVNITKLLNSSILNFPELRRLKYYQLPCIQNSKLKCFYDEKHMCICDKNRYSNCFEFNHNITYTCQGYNYCQNNGTCFQDNATCPTTSICMCDKCYYGSKCQLDTKGFSLSLDAIFGYYIKPSVSFFKQSKSVKITATITILMFIAGFISGSLSILTFKRKGSVAVGCGIYLLTASIISLLSISIFTMKFWQLVLFQMNSIKNQSFIYLSCLLTDMLLKVLLCSGDWLNACVAIERALTAIQGVNFKKAKSRYIAKCIIPIVLLLIIASYIHDPISRQLFHDEDEQRTWCILNYSVKLKIFDKIINLFHFLTPFIINFFSAVIIIIQVFRTRSKSQAYGTRKSLLFAQIKRHKHLLISPCITILLVLPRLIISLMSRCMESPRDPWLLLTGYYISCVPPLLISVIFILPSEKYTDEFLTVIRRKRTTA